MESGESAFEARLECHDYLVHGHTVTREPVREMRLLHFIVELCEHDPVVEPALRQKVDEVRERVREPHRSILGIDGHQRIEPASVFREGRRLLVLPGG